MEQAMINDGVVPLPLTPQDTLLRQHVGPLGSIDMYWLMYPPELYALWQLVMETINKADVQSESATTAFLKISMLGQMPISPLVWFESPEGTKTNWTFMGGNPLCSHIQKSRTSHRNLDFVDTCTAIVQETIMPGGYGVVFAYFVNSGEVSPAICSTGTKDVSLCASLLNATTEFVATYVRLQGRQLIAEMAKQSERRSPK